MARIFKIQGMGVSPVGVGRKREVMLEMRNKENGRSALANLRGRRQKAGEGHGKPSTLLENSRC